ncbi:MAG TPA: acyltransferase [Actinomycetales bacterium]|nr:acyltransferase [Actinomycetales bacterium]
MTTDTMSASRRTSVPTPAAPPATHDPATHDRATHDRATPSRPTIAALTGLRAVSALWVVLFHYRSDVLTLVPALRPLEPVMAAGYLGVDVFFVLSGFVLAYNYSERLARWRPREAASFVQNRVARVWPVHLVTLHADLLQAWVVGTLGVTAGGHRRTVSAYLQNLTMTHAWWNDRPSFNAPAWSISAEWAAYLACPLLLLALARLRRARVTVALALLGYAVMLTIFALWALPNGNVAHAGMLRLAVEFCAGVLALRVYQRSPRLLGRLALPLVVGLAAVVLLVPAAHHGYWLAPALGLLVLCLALDAGPLARVLARRTFVFWGEASYCLYMTHVLLMPGLHAVLSPSDVASNGPLVRVGVLTGYAVVLAGAAVLLHRYVEVPARNRLRSRSVPGPPRAVAP